MTRRSAPVKRKETSSKTLRRQLELHLDEQLRVAMKMRDDAARYRASAVECDALAARIEDHVARARKKIKESS